MESRRFYTSPVSHHNLEQWDDLAAGLERAVRESSPDVLVELGREPVFTYGTDAYDALEAVRRLEVAPRRVRFDLWNAVVRYETLGVAFGSAITPQEADTITRRLEKNELAEQTFLRAVEGPYDIDSAQVYGYSFGQAGDDEADEQAIEQLLDPFDTPLYIGPRRCILDANENVDNDAFELFSEDENVVVFIARDDDAARRLWKSSTSHGLIALFAGDPADQALIERFTHLEDLRILLNEQPSAGMRVSLGRCHTDDNLVVVYTPPEEPEIDQPLLFVI